jgi:target of rapamycin complex subunit LST8
MWKMGEPEHIREVIPHPSKRHIQTLELSSDSTKLVAANADGCIFVYETTDLITDSSAKPLSVFVAVSGNQKCYITRTRLSMDSSVLACTLSTGYIKVFQMLDVVTRHLDETSDSYGIVDSNVQPFRSIEAHIGWVWDAVFVGDASNYLFSCSFNAQVMLWNLDQDHGSTEYPGHTKAVVCMAIKEQMGGT